MSTTRIHNKKSLKMYKDINRTVPSPSVRIPWFLISQFCRSHYANPFHLWSPFIIENAKGFLNSCQNVNLTNPFSLILTI